MNIHRFLSLLSGGALSLVACGGSTSSGGNAPPVGASDFATSYAHAVCDDLAGCCQKSGIGYDANNCITSVQGIVQGFLVNPANASGATYDATAAGNCIAEVKSAAQACTDGTAYMGSIDSACNKVYSGKGQPGDTCKSSADCAVPSDGTVTCESWATSGSDGGTQSGSQCQVRKTPKAGDACGSSSSNGAPPSVVAACDFGESDAFKCDYQTSTCQPRSAVGASCETSSDCVTTAFCSSGSCAARLGVGSACTQYSDVCDGASRCDATTMKCAAKLADGQACMSSTDCAGGRCTSNKCSSSSFADPSVCGGVAH